MPDLFDAVITQVLFWHVTVAQIPKYVTSEVPVSFGSSIYHHDGNTSPTTCRDAATTLSTKNVTSNTRTRVTMVTDFFRLLLPQCQSNLNFGINIWLRLGNSAITESIWAKLVYVHQLFITTSIHIHSQDRIYPLILALPLVYFSTTRYIQSWTYSLTTTCLHQSILQESGLVIVLPSGDCLHQLPQYKMRMRRFTENIQLIHDRYNIISNVCTIWNLQYNLSLIFGIYHIYYTESDVVSHEYSVT